MPCPMPSCVYSFFLFRGKMRTGRLLARPWSSSHRCSLGQYTAATFSDPCARASVMALLAEKSILIGCRHVRWWARKCNEICTQSMMTINVVANELTAQLIHELEWAESQRGEIVYTEAVLYSISPLPLFHASLYCSRFGAIRIRERKDLTLIIAVKMAAERG